jgi:hypothetical protein
VKRRRRREEAELTARPSDYDDPFHERPPWWRDANYHEAGRGARPLTPTLFGKEP